MLRRAVELHRKSRQSCSSAPWGRNPSAEEVSENNLEADKPYKYRNKLSNSLRTALLRYLRLQTRNLNRTDRIRRQQVPDDWTLAIVDQRWIIAQNQLIDQEEFVEIIKLRQIEIHRAPIRFVLIRKLHAPGKLFTRLVKLFNLFKLGAALTMTSLWKVLDKNCKSKQIKLR